MLWIDGSNIWKVLLFLAQQALTEVLPEEGTCCQKYLCANIFMALTAVCFSRGGKTVWSCIFLPRLMCNYHPISEQTSRRSCVLGFGTRMCDSATSTYCIIMFLMNRPCGRSPNSRAQPIYPPSVSNLSSGFSNYTSINMARRQQFDSCMRSVRSLWSISPS